MIFVIVFFNRFIIGFDVLCIIVCCSFFMVDFLCDVVNGSVIVLFDSV